MPQIQTAASHAHRPVLTTLASLFSGIAFAFFLTEARRQPGWLVIGLFCLTLSVFMLVAVSRTYIVRLQDRIIRLEMKVRLAALGRDGDFGRLSTRQLIGLRFASDAELPALIERALRDNLTSKQIKEAIKDWQPDYHRT